MSVPSRQFTKLRVVKAAALTLAGAALCTLLSAQTTSNPPVVLTLNENPFGPSPQVAPALQAGLKDLFRYTTNEDAAVLTQVLAEKEGVAPEQIILGELLEPLGQQLGLEGGQGSEFVYSVPGYPALADAAGRVGGVVVSVPLNERLENDLPAIAARVNGRTRAVFLVNPHNPSGTVSDRKEFADFVRALPKQILVIVDEAYLEFSDDYAARTAVALTRAGENVLVYRTFAKAYGLAALPFGYAVAPRALADLLKQRGLGAVRDLNRLAITAALASVRDRSYLPQVHDAVAGERAKWHALLDELKLRHTDSQGNFVYFDTRRPQKEIAEKFRAAGVIVGRAFPPHNTWVRVTIGLPEENARTQAVLREVYR